MQTHLIDQKDIPMEKRSISIESMYMEHFPELVKKIPATVKEKQKTPNLLYWEQYGDRHPVPILGPPVTDEEKRKAAKERVAKKEIRECLAEARKEIKLGNQNKISSFFPKKKQQKKAKHSKRTH